MKIVTITSLNFIFVSGNARLIKFELRTQVAERKLENPPGELEGWRAILQQSPMNNVLYLTATTRKDQETHREIWINNHDGNQKFSSTLYHYLFTTKL